MKYNSKVFCLNLVSRLPYLFRRNFCCIGYPNYLLINTVLVKLHAFSWRSQYVCLDCSESLQTFACVLICMVKAGLEEEERAGLKLSLTSLLRVRKPRCFIHEPNEGLRIRFDQVINGGDAEEASPNERVFWLRSHYSNKITKCQSS
jgi:hypothetical protein